MVNSIKNLNLIDPIVASSQNDKVYDNLFSENGLPRNLSSRQSTTYSSLTSEGSPIIINDLMDESNVNTSSDSRSMSPQPNNNDFTGSNTPKYKFYRSTYKLNLPHKKSDPTPIDNSMWVEIRSKNDGFKQVFRYDPLFRRNSNKFDRIYLTCKGKLSDIKGMSIKPVRLQLNLIENATYLSKGIANENFSSLRLVEVSLEDTPSIFNIQELKPRGSDTSNINEDTFIGKSDCMIRFKDHPQLKRLLFNEEDYKHRGNRLYSFKTCTIRRLFYFELIIDWNIEGMLKQTEIHIDPMQVYCQSCPSDNNNSSTSTSRREPDFLPRYVEPPMYNEFPDELGINETTSPTPYEMVNNEER
ncbi:Art10p [Monosporozyma unispora]|nr:Art10p [Kazachstania unispora]